MKGNRPRFVSANGDFIRVVRHDDLDDAGIVRVPDGLRVKTEEYGPAPDSGQSVVTVHPEGTRIRVRDFGDIYYRAEWDVLPAATPAPA